jgi:hypothetical protein
MRKDENNELNKKLVEIYRLVPKIQIQIFIYQSEK